LDHAPAAFAADLRPSKLGGLRHIGDSGGFSKIARPGWISTTQLAKKKSTLTLALSIHTSGNVVVSLVRRRWTESFYLKSLKARYRLPQVNSVQI